MQMKMIERRYTSSRASAKCPRVAGVRCSFRRGRETPRHALRRGVLSERGSIVCRYTLRHEGLESPAFYQPPAAATATWALAGWLLTAAPHSEARYLL